VVSITLAASIIDMEGGTSSPPLSAVDHTLSPPTTPEGDHFNQVPIQHTPIMGNDSFADTIIITDKSRTQKSSQASSFDSTHETNTETNTLHPSSELVSPTQESTSQTAAIGSNLFSVILTDFKFMSLTPEISVTVLREEITRLARLASLEVTMEPKLLPQYPSRIPLLALFVYHLKFVT
jgi:hypothetical protein